MNRCLSLQSSDSNELTYKAGYPKINYPFENGSSHSDVSEQCELVKQPREVKADFREAQMNGGSLNNAEIADRCRIAIGGYGSTLCVEGHGNGSRYKPKKYK